MIASVIVPAYNSEKIIGACIKALGGQSVPSKDYETIVVDDGSKDETAKKAKELGAKVFSQANSGPAKARNLGARKAKGGIVVFTDADCVPENDWLEQMLAPFEDRKVVGVQGAYKTEQKSVVARFCQLEIEERYERMKKHSGKLDWVGSYSAAYRREEFLKAGGFDESFPIASGEDPELSYRLAKAGKALVFNPNAVVYHTHPDTPQKYFRAKFYRAFYRVGMYSRHTEKIVTDSYTTQELKLQIAAQYLSLLFLAAAPILLALGKIELSLTAGTLSLFFAVLHFVFILPFFAFALPKDREAAIYAITVGVPSRTWAFCLGLPAGILGVKI